MSEKDQKDQKFHEYDGIIEHDNNLPTWWLWTFLLTIIFSFLYLIHYELGGGDDQYQELAKAMAVIEKTQSHALTSAPMESEESLSEAFEKAGALELGAAQFTSKCAACHGNELQGSIGPNLLDKFWIHGEGSRLDIVKVIREGAPEKGMPPWGTVLKRDELYAVAAYILSKKGTQVPGAKTPEGQEVKGY